LKTGVAQAKSTTVDYSLDGALSSNYLFGLVSFETERVILTDYSSYTVVYSCSPDPYVESFLDGLKD